MIQDALADAEAHLGAALDQALAAGSTEAEVLGSILEQNGTPGEVARGYRELETRLLPVFPKPRHAPDYNPIQRFVGVLADPRA